MVEDQKLRQCLGKFATGVTVVSCRDQSGAPCGITVNSFCSVSLDPPLILWNIAKVSRSIQAFLNAEYFAINVLGSEQENLSARFAQSEPNLFSGVDYEYSQQQVPIIDGALAWFECRTHDIHPGGDHHIIVGEVIEYQATDGNPLLFYAGNYSSPEM